MHVRSPHRDALPLVLTHGWPGSIVEFLKVIGPLADPTAHGGDAADAFHVVCPSLPGYGFSDKPAQPGWKVERIAAAWAQLMARLGYDRYGAQGSDWGTSCHAIIGQQDPDHVAGIHLMPPLAAPDPATFDDLTERERAALAVARVRPTRMTPDTRKQQSTRPQTIGYGAGRLACRPVRLDRREVPGVDGLRRSPENALTRDELLDNVMLYWLPGTGASSGAAVLGEHSGGQSGSRARTPTSSPCPTGCSIFPKEIRGPRGGGRRSASPTSATGTSSTGAATSPRSSSRSCSSTRSARSSGSCDDDSDEEP